LCDVLAILQSSACTHSDVQTLQMSSVKFIARRAVISSIFSLRVYESTINFYSMVIPDVMHNW